MNNKNRPIKGKIDSNENDDPKTENHKKESFEYSFLRLSQLKIHGNNQSEIRKTVLKTWWLHAMPFVFAIITILLVGRNFLEKLLPLFF